MLLRVFARLKSLKSFATMYDYFREINDLQEIGPPVKLMLCVSPPTSLIFHHPDNTRQPTLLRLI